MTLNEPISMDCARALALHTLSEGGDTETGRLNYAFRRCVSRNPSPEEASQLLKLLNKETERFSGSDTKPWQLATEDPSHPPSLPRGATPAELAAWTVVSRVLLNLDETITKE